MSEERKRTILVVDHDEAMAQCIEAILRQAGFTVELAASGSEALRPLGDTRIDLVIVDQATVQRDAFTRLLEMRKNPAKMRVLVTCAGGREAELAKVLPTVEELRADATLPKPFRESELLAAVRTVLS